jgi:hypothetical protein
MYGIAVSIGPGQEGTTASESECCAHLDGFMTAVSAGWACVIDFLESCPLDRETRAMLRELRQDDWESESGRGGAEHVVHRAA